jgi:hypothetical protein
MWAVAGNKILRRRADNYRRRNLYFTRVDNSTAGDSSTATLILED